MCRAKCELTLKDSRVFRVPDVSSSIAGHTTALRDTQESEQFCVRSIARSRRSHALERSCSTVHTSHCAR